MLTVQCQGICLRQKSFRSIRDLQLFLNKMKSRVDEVAQLARGTLRLPQGREA